MELTGIHHLSAVTADAGRNHDFYTRVLGMRLVKKTVNQDDTGIYHLFYADGVGSPGTDLTFFEFPHAARERRGTHSISGTSLRVAGEGTLDWWRARFDAEGVSHGGITERHGRAALDFKDREGQRLTLVDDGGEGEVHTWDKSPVPAERQIRGLGPITMSVPDIGPTEAVLLRVMGMRKAGDYATPGNEETRTHVYEMGPGGAGAELHVAVEPEASPVRPGAGGVHHVAFRVPDADYEAWADRLRSLRLPSSGPVDRFYFRSLYFREPGGILFEIATDGPGFASDTETVETLGQSLALPPFLEPRRAEIEARLKPL